MALVIVVTM